MSVLETATALHWAIVPASLDQMLDIAEGVHKTTPETLAALEAKAADKGERLKMRDGVAILEIAGPLFKKANMFVRVSGATSYEILRRDLQVAIDDPSVNSIMLHVDSPGGEANGCDELAAAIYAARGKKPITAFVSGQACSGGYWLACAADKVVVSDLAILGSIGVVLGVADRTKADERNGVIRRDFVSSQSPFKRPDHTTDAGASKIQKMVDDLAEVFVSAVAKYRGVSAETVISEFGAGGVEIGANAVAKGMADEVGQFEATFETLKVRGQNRRFPQRSQGVLLMTDKTNAAVTESVDTAKIESDAAAKATAATQARIKAIMTSDEGKAMPTQAAHFAYETNLSAVDAIAAMKSGKVDFDSKKPEADKTAAFEERKTEAGALGLGKPEARGEKTESKSVWSRALSYSNNA